MKRNLAVVLAVAMIFVFAACNKEQTAKAEKYCSNCGEGITKDAAFCEHCGAAINETTGESSNAPISSNETSTESNTSTETSTPTETSEPTGSSKPTESSNPTESNNPTISSEPTATTKPLTDQEKAVERAEELAKTGFGYSRVEMIAALEGEGFSKEDATYGADWGLFLYEDQAVKRAKYLLTKRAYSYQLLHNQLDMAGFFYTQCDYGVQNCGANWNEQAVRRAKELIDSKKGYSEKGLFLCIGFRNEEAEYAKEKIAGSINWNEQAVFAAKTLLSQDDYSYEDLVKKLQENCTSEFKQGGFTEEQAIFGANNCGEYSN